MHTKLQPSAVENAQNMTCLVELGTGKRNGAVIFFIAFSPQDIERRPIGICGAAFLTAMSNQYFGMDRYVRPIDSSPPFWLNRVTDWLEKLSALQSPSLISSGERNSTLYLS